MTTYVRSIVDEEMKEQAELTLKAMGLDMSTYVRMALTVLVQERRIPFEVKLANIPNKTTIKSMVELKGKREKGEYRKITPDELFNELEKTTKSKRAKFPREVMYSKEFKKDWQRLERSGRYNMNALKTAIAALVLNDVPLGTEYRDHQLTGNYEGFRECHIGGDFLLIYQINDKKNGIEFARTGTHADLFQM